MFVFVCRFESIFTKKYCPNPHRMSHCWAEQEAPDMLLYSDCVRCSYVALCWNGTDCWCVGGSFHHCYLVSKTSGIILGWHSIIQGRRTAFLTAWHLWGAVRLQTDWNQHISLLLAAHRLLGTRILKVSVHWCAKFSVWGHTQIDRVLCSVASHKLWQLVLHKEVDTWRPKA
jgi:hypothetical protein